MRLTMIAHNATCHYEGVNTVNDAHKATCHYEGVNAVNDGCAQGHLSL